MKMVFLHDLNAEAFSLLKYYQRVCAAGALNYEKDIEFQRQPFWVRWQQRQVYRDLRNEGLRLLAQKTYLETKLAIVPIRPIPPSTTESTDEAWSKYEDEFNHQQLNNTFYDLRLLMRLNGM